MRMKGCGRTPLWRQLGKLMPVFQRDGGTVTDPYEYRPPIKLSNPRLRKLAAALGPPYLRVSGTWMNSTFFQDDDAAAMGLPRRATKPYLRGRNGRVSLIFPKQ